MVLKSVPKVLLVISIWPSICGWWKVLYKSLVPNLLYKVFQKWLRNLISLSSTMVLGMPYKLIISLMNNLATLLASLVLLHGVKWAVLAKWSTTIMMESLTFCVLSNITMNSMFGSSYGGSGTDEGVYEPNLKRALALWQVPHLVMMAWHLPTFFANKSVL